MGWFLKFSKYFLLSLIRRSSERSCKARAAQPTRKSSSTKKSPSPLPRQTNLIDIDNNSMLPNQQNSYRYDIAAMKSECRGFTSSQSTEEATPFDFDAAAMQMATTMASNVDDFDDVSSSLSDQNDNNDYIEFMPSKSSIHNTMCQTLPWDFTTHQDDLPVKSQRFADNKYDHVNNSRGSDLKVHNESLGGPYAAFVNGENLKIREVMKSAAMPNLYTTPDERLKHICKRLSTLKKRVAAFEESFELENGYRPSHSIKINDRFVKNAVAEMHKLRKEKQVLKADPMVALCLKPGSLTDGHKVLQMKETICEIEQVGFISGLAITQSSIILNYSCVFFSSGIFVYFSVCMPSVTKNIVQMAWMRCMPINLYKRKLLFSVLFSILNRYTVGLIHATNVMQPVHYTIDIAYSNVW